MSIAAYNITDLLSSRPEAQSSQPSGQSPYDIQNATATYFERELAGCAPDHGRLARPEAITATRPESGSRRGSPLSCCRGLLEERADQVVREHDRRRLRGAKLEQRLQVAHGRATGCSLITAAASFVPGWMSRFRSERRVETRRASTHLSRVGPDVPMPA